MSSKSFSLERGGSVTVESSPSNPDMCLVETPTRTTAYTPTELDRLLDCLTEYRAERDSRHPPTFAEHGTQEEPW